MPPPLDVSKRLRVLLCPRVWPHHKKQTKDGLLCRWAGVWTSARTWARTNWIGRIGLLGDRERKWALVIDIRLCAVIDATRWRRYTHNERKTPVEVLYTARAACGNNQRNKSSSKAYIHKHAYRYIFKPTHSSMLKNIRKSQKKPNGKARNCHRCLWKGSRKRYLKQELLWGARCLTKTK